MMNLNTFVYSRYNDELKYFCLVGIMMNLNTFVYSRYNDELKYFCLQSV
jgi:hypothetical protein